MRVLLDTNILIHREAATVVRDDIGHLFRWLDRLHAEKCLHPHSLNEIRTHQDPLVVRSFETKAESYHELRTLASDPPGFELIRRGDRTTNDRIDSDILREVFANRVDLLISEDRGIHAKAALLGIQDRVLRIDAFLERAIRENPDLKSYPVLAVKKQYFGDIHVEDPFFDSFRADYPGFNTWFNRKADEIAYTCFEEGRILAFLYLKTEGANEPYTDISPVFAPMRRLKIGTFKVVLNGFRLGERFLKIIFDNALNQQAAEVYVTIFEHNPDQLRLIHLLEQWGFVRHGTKKSNAGEEGVWVRSFRNRASRTLPRTTFPFVCRAARKFVVPIYPNYHTELLPDSILKTESPMDFVENLPHRNAIRKAYISRSYFRDLSPGDIIVFYRTSSGTGPAHYTSVATTIGVVESVHLNLTTFEAFRDACAAVSVFPDTELRKHWDYRSSNRPFVVRFLYVYSFPKRPNLSQMKSEGVLQEAPRGFEPLTECGFQKLLQLANADQRLIVDQT